MVVTRDTLSHESRNKAAVQDLTVTLPPHWRINFNFVFELVR